MPDSPEDEERESHDIDVSDEAVSRSTDMARRVAAKKAPEMVRVLAKIARGTFVPEPGQPKVDERVTAARLVLEYGIGKPTAAKALDSREPDVTPESMFGAPPPVPAPVPAPVPEESREPD